MGGNGSGGMEGQMMTMMPLGVLFAGYIYHYMNGVAFALIYILLFGSQRYYWGIVYALLFTELGMMVSLPLLMPGASIAALNMGGGVLLGSMLAHTALGYVLGFFSEHEVHGNGLIQEILAWSTQKG